MKRLLLLLLVFGVTACSGNVIPAPEGTLQGHVTIGPLVPVQREGVPDPTPAPEVYAARKVVIYDASGQRQIAEVDIDNNGNYQVNLPVGTYTVDINRIGIDSAAGLPAQVEIVAGVVTVLDIDIDTGIR